MVTTLPYCACCGAQMECTSRFAPHPYIDCPTCGYATYAAAANSDRLAQLYDTTYFAEVLVTADRDSRRREARKRLEWMARRVPPGSRVLEIGSSEGSFVEMALAAGFRAEGLEPNERLSAELRARSIPVATGVVETFHMQPASLDAVVGWHVLEHLADPGLALQRVSAWLRPGGALLLEVPNAGSVGAARGGAAWPWLSPEHHVSQFTPQALRGLVQHSGFVDVATSTVSFAYYAAGRLDWLRRTFWRGHVGYFQGVRAHPLRPHRSFHELLRCVARNSRA